MPAKEAQAILDSVVGLLVDHLKAGDELRLTHGHEPRWCASSAVMNNDNAGGRTRRLG